MTTDPEPIPAAEPFRIWPLVQLALGLPIFFAVCFFIPAGNWSWQRGWLFVGVFLAAMVVSSVVLWLINPAIYAARTQMHKVSKRWDAILLSVGLPTMLAIFLVAALDDGRFHWLPMPWSVVALGYILFLLGFALMAWAQGVNKFFEPTVRIQTDRGHKVIDTGPYAIVRHPGYVAAIVLFAGIALSLGSLWALIPVAFASGLLILRTRWEDQTLQSELPGYKEYTQRVRSRLIPGVW